MDILGVVIMLAGVFSSGTCILVSLLLWNADNNNTCDVYV